MRIIGIDIGKVSFKAVWLENQDGKIRIQKTFFKTHQQEIDKVWSELKTIWAIGKKDKKIVVTGRLRKSLPFSSVVEKVAQEKAVKFFYPQKEIDLIRIGGGGFSVLKIRNSGPTEYRQNPRCAAGTGVFLDQIITRVGLDIFQADQLAKEAKGIEITARCGVTMKTDFTHLLNTGHKIEEILAGLLDSSAKNAVSLALKSEIAPYLLIIGGLSGSKRIVKTIKESLPWVKVVVPKYALFFEAIGAGLIEKGREASSFSSSPINFLPGLKDSLNLVTKKSSIIPNSLNFSKFQSNQDPLILGLDIGSTGSKLVIFGQEPIFETYTETRGQPIKAAQSLIEKIPRELSNQIRAVGCTGSGREIVANLLRSGLDQKDHKRIFVLNEIAAHAQGAHFYDKEVDTVVDIGGQDAKFTKLEQGQVVDSCMNTVCSAGTGSFLAEQIQLLGVKDVVEFGKLALESPRAVDLGQHCAVFISEQIDEAKQKGAKLPEIIAGLYYSIIKNYNNRVKGLRSYGKKIFLQGKPAENLALGCALAKITGQPIIIPPSPGSTGALGIAILTEKELDRDFLKNENPLNLKPFLNSKILEKREFRCQSKDGCLDGNLCPVEAVKVKIGEKEENFFWGGACDKYEKRPGKNPVLAQAPRPFNERENLILSLLNQKENNSAKHEISLGNSKHRPALGNFSKNVVIPRGLETEEILPLAITFFQELGFKIKFQRSLNLDFLEQGSKLCSANFCAPLQLLAGQAKFSEKEDFVFLPKVIEISGLVKEPEKQRCYVCPLSQASPDIFSPKLSNKVLQPILNFKKNYQSNLKEFKKMGLELGCSSRAIKEAFFKAIKAQEDFEEKCQKIGERVLKFAQENKLPVIVVLGHPYIINCSLLLTGIAETISENGAIALPADCYPLEKKKDSVSQEIYWAYGQKLLTIASQIRNQKGVFPLWLSVYSCGPDSFLLHFFQYLVQGKPYAILESDAYTGKAGFGTRIEAFLYAVKNYRQDQKAFPDLSRFKKEEDLAKVIKGPQKKKNKLLLPWMGEGSKVMVALLKSAGIEAQAISIGDNESLDLGRKFTSGKECLPMIITLGCLLKHLKNHVGDFYYLMPATDGPCRLGQYHILFKIILEKLGLDKRVKIISPSSETGYRMAVNSATLAKFWASVVLVDLIKAALLDIRPEEKVPGSTQKVFDFYIKRAEEIIAQKNNNWWNLRNLWGIKQLAKQAACDFSKIKRDAKKQGKPIVVLAGEIYIRMEDFSNNWLIKELENLGVKVYLSPYREWFSYVSYLRLKKQGLRKTNWFKINCVYWAEKMVEEKIYRIFSRALGWHQDHKIEEILEVAKPYLSQLKPLGEAALTIGLPLLLWQKKEIQGAVIVGPLECMPTRIAETQLNLVSQKTGLPVLSLAFNGDPLDRNVLESFVWDLISKQ